MRLLAISLALFLAVVLVAAPVVASPRQELSEARDKFEAGDYATAQGVLSGLLYPQVRLASAGDLAEAHLLLGFCYYELNQKDNARREFEEALALDERLRVDSNVFSDDAVRYFDTIAEELRRKAEEDKERQEKARLQAAIERLVLVEPRRYWVNFMPLGAGQFQNGERGKGAFFLGAQAITGGTSLAIFSYQVFRYGLLSGDVPNDEVDQVRTLQQVQIGSAVLFYGFWVWGIFDSLANYEHVVRRQVDPDTIKQLDIDLDLPEPEASSRLRLLPMAGPQHGGLGIHMEF